MFVGFTDEDSTMLQSLAVHLEEVRGPGLDQAFDHVAGIVDLQAVLGAGRDVNLLKRAQSDYLASLLKSDNHAAHSKLLNRIGRAHHVHRIPPQWHLGFTSHLLRAFLHSVVDHHSDDPATIHRGVDAVVKAMFIDIAAILDAYDREGRSHAVDAIESLGGQMSDANSTMLESTRALAESLSRQSRAATDQASAVAEVSATLSELSQTS
jgi:hypothetical protein